MARVVRIIETGKAKVYQLLPRPFNKMYLAVLDRSTLLIAMHMEQAVAALARTADGTKRTVFTNKSLAVAPKGFQAHPALASRRPERDDHGQRMSR